MNHSSLFGLATIIGGEKCFKKESSNFIFNVPNLNESSPRGGSKTEVPTLFDGNGLFETRKRVPWVQAGEEDIVWGTQIRGISVSELSYGLYHGIHRHFSPPFGRIIMFGSLLPSIEQANPSELFLACLVFLFCRSHFSTKCRVFSGCVRFSSIKKERNSFNFTSRMLASFKKASPLRASNVFKKRSQVGNQLKTKNIG